MNILSSFDMNLLVIKVPNALFLATKYLFRLRFAFLSCHSIPAQTRESFRWSHVNKHSIYAL